MYKRLIILVFIISLESLAMQNGKGHASHHDREQVRQAVAEYMLAKNNGKSQDLETYKTSLKTEAVTFENDGKTARLDDSKKKKRYWYYADSKKVEEGEITKPK